MQAKTVEVPNKETRNYLRVATISNKNVLRYLYIGNDENSIELLTKNFNSGANAKSLEEAKSFLSDRSQDKTDVIIIDIAYIEKQIRDFHSFLKNRELDVIPVLYNDRLLNFTSRNHEIIDDVIDLNNLQFDLANKILFLKKIKEYNLFRNNARNYNIEPSHPAIKRILDLIIASLLIILLSPLFLIIAVAIKIESRGPVFYNAKRAGRGFKIFSFYKFRTMVINADKKIQELAHLNQYSGNGHSPQFFKISNDPRITRVGRFLRNTSMDELPQLFNVLKGDMSIVGNRPLPLYEAATLTTNEFVERFMAPAGITGLWQIKKRGQSNMSTEERISLDISYVRKSNLLYDLWIMANTPSALIQRDNV